MKSPSFQTIEVNRRCECDVVKHLNIRNIGFSRPAKGFRYWNEYYYLTRQVRQIMFKVECCSPSQLGMKISICSINNLQPCLDPPKSKWPDGQRRINEAGKCIRENTAFWTILRSGVRVQACHAAVWIVFAFGREGVMTTHASWLAQVGRGVMTGQRARWLMT